jgi:hypothetical protein
MRKTCDLYGNPVADASELQKVEQEEHDSCHEAGVASASNVAVEILNSSLQAVGNHQIRRSSCKKNSILRKRFRKSPV